MAAERYTHGHHESVLRSHTQRTVQSSASYLVPHLRTGQRLLDVGCGPATITAGLAKLVAPGLVVGVDRTAAVLDIGRGYLKERKVGNATLGLADAYRLPFPDGAFDVVHAHQLLHHLADPVAALAGMRRACAPGGVVAVREVDYPAMTWYPHDPILDRWLEVYLAISRGNGAEPAAGRRLHSWARQAGFTDVDCSASVWCYASPEQRTWWAGVWADRVTLSAFADQALEGGFATRSDLSRMAAAWHRWAASDGGWFSVLSGEIVCRR